MPDPNEENKTFTTEDVLKFADDPIKKLPENFILENRDRDPRSHVNDILNKNDYKATEAIVDQEADSPMVGVAYGKDGKPAAIIIADENGKPAKEIDYGENGQPARACTLRGNRHDVENEVIFDKNGVPKSAAYYDEKGRKRSSAKYDEKGEMTSSTNYYKNGNKKSFVEYEDGKKSTETSYKPNGKPINTVGFDKDGKGESVTVYNDNGKADHTNYYDKNGKRNMKRTYDEKGNLDSEIKYKKDGFTPESLTKFNDNGQPIGTVNFGNHFIPKSVEIYKNEKSKAENLLDSVTKKEDKTKDTKAPVDPSKKKMMERADGKPAAKLPETKKPGISNGALEGVSRGVAGAAGPILTGATKAAGKGLEALKNGLSK